MASSMRFAGGFGLRMLALLGALGLLGWAWLTPELAAARLLAALVVALAAWSLWHHVGRTNRELARFVEALRYGDFSQGFSRSGNGAGFDRLGTALDDAMRQLRHERAAAGEQERVLAALADEAPAALLLVDNDGRVTLASKAARKLFHRLPGTRVEDFAGFGGEIVHVLRDGAAGFRGVVPLTIDGAAQRAMVSRAALARTGAPLGIVAVQPIQAELSGVELAAQADLVRVLTHEIMNSMTPVVSLAESASGLMARLDTGADPDLADAHMAVATLARRASGIMHFVEAYRSYARVPTVERRRFAAAGWAEEIARLFAASEAGAGVAFAWEAEPANLLLDADPDLLAQVAINLLKNGAEAARAASAGPRVALAMTLAPGGRVRLRFADNGGGIPATLREDIFLPFFTTKPQGTGVGLSLARRIVVAHGGTIALADATQGTAFEILL